MVCIFSCGVSILFLLSMLFMNYGIDTNELMRQFRSNLSEQETKLYNEIVRERRNIYLKGFVISLVLSLAVTYYYYYTQRLELISLLCLSGMITFFTTYFYYILSPKEHDLMVVEFDDVQKRQSWAHVYRMMQYNYHFGIFLGLFAAIALTYSMYRKHYAPWGIVAVVSECGTKNHVSPK